MIVILTITLVLVAAASNALMDLSSEGRLGKGWWDKETGWRNKWKLGQPANGPAFPGSTTVFVWVTDGWHLFQMIFHTCWQMAIAIHTDKWLIAFITIKVVFSVCFEIIYSRIKGRNGNSKRS